MLNSKNYNDFFSSTAEDSRRIINSKLSKDIISFSQINEFPIYNGLYFVFLEDIIVYIGKADKQNIRERCKQYINFSSGGTLRKKVECIKECNSSLAIDFIKSNLSAKFIHINNVDSISVLEEVAIWVYQPKLNVVKPTTFSFKKLSEF